jgi:lipoprotein signal peptidase
MQLPYAPSRLARPSLTAPLPHAASFAAVAGLVVYGDFVTKQLAVALWSGETRPLLGHLVGIHVVHNTLGAFSTSLGRLTWEINVASTLVAVLLAMAVCPLLARLDAAAPTALGLIAGAGLGNLLSLLGSSVGVPDFLALGDSRGGALVLNVADVAAYLGIACCGRPAWVVMRTLASRSAERVAE